MNMWMIAWFELRRMLQSRSVVLNLFLLPLLLIFILGTALSSFFNTDDKPLDLEPVKVAIVDHVGDSTGPTSQLHAYLRSPEIMEMITLSNVSTTNEAEKLLRSKEVDYVVTVPTNFNQLVMNGEQAKLQLMLGSDRIANRVAGTIFDNFLDEVNHAQGIMVVMETLDMSQEAVPASSSPEDARSYVTIGKLSDEAPTYSASQYYAVAMLMMFLLYAGSTASSSLYEEKDNHTLYRLQSMPVPHIQILVGKMLGSSIVAMAQTIVIITVSSTLYGTYWGEQPLLLAITCMLIIVASMTIAALVSFIAKTSSSANNIFQFMIIGMTFFSGGFIPIPMGLMQSIGKLTVSQWGMESILQIMLHGNTSEIMSSIGVLAWICVALLGVTAVVYRKVGYHA